MEPQTDDSSRTIGAAGAGVEATDIPSCQGCRKRKLKCSRDQPVCAHCRRLDAPCEYDVTRNKPGVKPGAVGSLCRRVEILEEALLKSQQQGVEGVNVAQVEQTPASNSSDVVGVLSMLARELHKLNSNQRPALQHSSPDTGISPATTDTYAQPRKRRRVDSCGNPAIELATPLQDLENRQDSAATLPPPGLLEDVVTAYFDLVQPWIPLLHETQFRRRLHNHEKLPRLVLVLHAMVVAAVRFVDHAEHHLSNDAIVQMTRRSRNLVVLTAMNSLSVESLQALVIIAFTDIGNGEASKTWSIIGSLTRTVEYLQLSVEPDDKAGEHLLAPLLTIPPAQSWTDEEERRRVFWTIFCLDRFCSVSTGWNTSLTADDVQRRLPADGGLWHKEEAVTTPFFGIWDRSAARIGNSITFLPGHFPSSDQASDAATATSQAKTSGPDTVDMTTVGAFAYCIEATESLSRVTTYFLRQKISFNDRQQVSSWLTRFKELDLRLVHWKMFLPQKWRDSNISRQPAHIDMDPNLTLAHVTHNASMILLHQRIAYPEPQWASVVKLPCATSAETCQVAAVETTTITQKYLRYKPEHSPLNNQFTFCVFISARVLLVHWRHHGAQLASEFWTLVDSLDDMARRWVGPNAHHAAADCLAGRYAAHLRQLHIRCHSDPSYTIDVLGYPSPINLPSSPTNFQGNKPTPTAFHDAILDDMCAVPMAGFQAQDMDGQTLRQPDELSAISHMLMDQQFMSMDRIISFDDNLFTAPDCGGLAWQN